MHVILWSRRGAGEHYNGPGMAALKTYSAMSREHNVNVSLLHGVKEHEDNKLFNELICIGDIGDQASARGTHLSVKIARIFRYIQSIFKCRQWVSKNAHKFDIFHGLGLKPLTMEIADLFLTMGVPTIIKVTELGPNGLLGGIQFRSRFIKQLSRTTGFISISKEITDALLSLGIERDKIHNIPNGVDHDKFVPASITRKITERGNLGVSECFTVVFCGAIIERKRPHLIVEALYKLLTEHDVDARLLLVGPMPDQSYLNKMNRNIETYRLGDKVRFIGHTENVNEYLQLADVFCLPSIQEGLPNAALEAMSCGLPIVITRFSGASDLGAVDGVTGRVVEENPTSIASGLLEFAMSESVLYSTSKGAREFVIKEFSLLAVAHRQFELFQSLVTNSVNNVDNREYS